MTHIREIEATDSMDWEYFYRGKNGDYPHWAHKLWELLHDAMEHIPCSTCQPEGVKLMKAMHDLISIHLDKEPFDEANFREVAMQYAHALSQLGAAHKKHNLIEEEHLLA